MERLVGQEQEGDRIVHAGLGKEGVIERLSPNGVLIHWKGCGHCGLKAERVSYMRSYLRMGTVTVYAPPTGHYAGPRS